MQLYSDSRDNLRMEISCVVILWVIVLALVCGIAIVVPELELLSFLILYSTALIAITGCIRLKDSSAPVYLSVEARDCNGAMWMETRVRVYFGSP